MLDYLQIDFHRLSNMAHDRVNELALIKPMYARDNILFRHPPLAEIDVALVSLDADDHDGLYVADLNEAVEAPYTA